MKKLKRSLINSLIKARKATSNKGNYGHALIIAGNKGSMGAAVIAARACLRAGTGLLTVNVPHEERCILQATIPEAMLMMRENFKYDLNHYSAIGFGPGVGTGKDAEGMLTYIFAKHNKPLLLDADALSILAGNKFFFDEIPKWTILTPHSKEFDRLFGIHKNRSERINTAVIKAKEHNIIIILKGHKTLITYKGKAFLNTTGNAGLAKGGSGDALTGIITAFLSQGYRPVSAVKIGVYLHGLAADIALENQSLESMLITDVIENIGKAFKKIAKQLK